MKRRTFLRRTVPAAITLPFALNGLRFRAMAQSPELHKLLGAEETDRVLVIIQLAGGNDGLNMVIPVDDDIYHNSRPTIRIKKEDALPLSGQPQFGLHPRLGGIQQMFTEGQLSIVQNIGYSGYSLSHFTGTEIWHTASGPAPDQYQSTGWIGRYLHQEFPDYPLVLPEHPPAIQISSATSSIFGIKGATTGVALNDPATFYELVNGAPNIEDDPVPDTLAGREWEFVQTINTQSIEYAEVIRAAALKATNIASYAPDNDLAQSLAIIARLIAGGLKTRIYMVTLGNFDSHSGQLVMQGELLRRMGPAVKAFMDDLVALNVDNRVVGMTYSEFGRRISENGTGTDHGNAAPHLVFGTPIDGGKLFGGLPDLANPDENGNLRHGIDFPCYYASVFSPLFNVTGARLQDILPIGLCDESSYVPLYGVSSVDEPSIGVEITTLAAAPNPANAETTITYTLAHAGNVEISLHSIDGRLESVVLNEHTDRGEQRVRVDLSSLAAGTYIYRIKTDSGASSGRVVVVH